MASVIMIMLFEKRYMKFLFIIFALTLLPFQCVLALSTTAEEYEIKAAYLFNLGHFIRWNPEISAQYFGICVFGENPFGTNLNYVIERGKQIQEHNVLFKQLTSFKDIDSCHILFLSRSANAQFAAIFAAIKNKPILTVGDTERFIVEGGMVQFYRYEDKIRLMINPQIIKDSGLKANSRLMEIAQIVKK